MGWNTVAFILNDFAYDINKSPRTVAYKLANPAQTCDDGADARADAVADEVGEERLHLQALEVLPAFHASERKFFTAGGNCITELKFIRTRIDPKTKKRVVVLELPDYLQNYKRF